MSEPVKPREIEDVLSSIRRLVSEEAEAMTRPVPGATDRLVLTPALRVPAEKVKADAEAPAPAPRPAPPAAGSGHRADAARHDDEPPMPPVPQSAPRDDVHDTGPQQGTAEDRSPASAAMPAEEAAERGAQSADPVAPAAEDGQDDISLEARVAELEAAVSDFDDSWEPDGSTVGPTDPDHGADAWMSPGLDDDDYDDEPLFDGPEETAILDEDMLRDLVSDIVRQELQGALGERITRNVRKLVRREINRAMAARDFD